MMKILLAFLLTIQIIRCQEPVKEAFDPQSQRILAEEQRKIFPYISFEQTLFAFPYLARNIKATVFQQLIQQNCTEYYESPNITVKIVIANNTVMAQYNRSIQWLTIRTESLVYQLKKITNQTKVPDLYMIVDESDFINFPGKNTQKKKICESLPIFHFNKNCSQGSYDRNKLLMIDPYMMKGWDKDYQRIKKESSKIKFEDKKPMAMFRGMATSSHYQYDRYQTREDIFRYHHRGAYVILSYQYPELIDARFTLGPNGLHTSVQNIIGKDKQVKTGYVTIEDQLKFKYLLTADGFSSAWKRLAWILTSNSVMIKPHSHYIQWFYDKLVPNQHYILVKKDLSDLIPKLKWLQKNDAKSLQIIKNANNFVEKYLTPQAVQNFTLDLLLKYANIQKLNLSKQEQVDILAKNRTIDQVLLQQRVKELNDLDRALEQKWMATTSLSSVASVMKKFPGLKQKMGIQYLLNIIETNSISKYFLKVLLLDHKVYCEGQAQQEQSRKILLDFLSQMRKQYQLPDSFFLVLEENQREKLMKSQTTKNLIEQLPIFLFSKNVSDSVQSNKFLLPNIKYLTNFQQKVSEHKRKSLNISWKQKLNKAYFRAKPIKIDNNFQVLVKNNPYKYLHQAGFALLSYERPQLVDAKIVLAKNQSMDPILEELVNRIGFQNMIDDSFQQDEESNYKYQLSTTDSSTSLRVPIILSSNAILMRPLSQRTQWFEQKLIPNTHYVPIDDELFNLFDKIKFLKKNQPKAADMIREANNLAASLFSRDNIKKHVANSLRQYSSYQNLLVESSLKSFMQKGQSIKSAITSSKAQKNKIKVIRSEHAQQRKQLDAEEINNVKNQNQNTPSILQTVILASFIVLFLLAIVCMGILLCRTYSLQKGLNSHQTLSNDSTGTDRENMQMMEDNKKKDKGVKILA